MAANVQASGAARRFVVRRRSGDKRAARGRLSGRGAVGRCADLVPNEKVKSVIRETIAERRCQAVRSRVRERGKRAAARSDEQAWRCQAMSGFVLSSAVRRLPSGVEAWGKRAAARPGDARACAARRGRMRGPGARRLAGRPHRAAAPCCMGTMDAIRTGAENRAWRNSPRAFPRGG